MALFSLLHSAGTKIGVVELDASLSESHESVVAATKHPVERGSQITDHLRPEPVTLTIEGIVSNTPISRKQQVRAVAFGGSEFASTSVAASPYGVPGYAEEAFAKLREFQERGELLTVVTSLHTYENMALTKLTVPRDRSTGDALRFTATLEEIRFAENKTTSIVTPADPRAASKVKLGRQAKKVVRAAKAVRKAAAPWVDPFEKALAPSFDKLRRAL
jgi:hypothetical protein